MYCSKDFGYYFLLASLNISRWFDTRRDIRAQRKENRKNNRKKWRKLCDDVNRAEQAVVDARLAITIPSEKLDKDTKVCFVRYDGTASSENSEDTKTVPYALLSPCDDLGENGRCQKECAAGEDECPMKAQSDAYGDALEKLQIAKDARRDFFWEMLAINGVRIDELWLLTRDIRQKRRSLDCKRDEKLDKFGLINAVPVNREKPIDPERRTHCIIWGVKPGEQDDICDNYPKGEAWKTSWCDDSTCPCIAAHQDYINTKRELATAKTEYQNLLAQRRVMLRQMLGIKDKAKK